MAKQELEHITLQVSSEMHKRIETQIEAESARLAGSTVTRSDFLRRMILIGLAQHEESLKPLRKAK